MSKIVRVGMVAVMAIVACVGVSVRAEVKLPGVFTQAAFASQSCVPSEHSSSSMQLTPSPV